MRPGGPCYRGGAHAEEIKMAEEGAAPAPPPPAFIPGQAVRPGARARRGGKEHPQSRAEIRVAVAGREGCIQDLKRLAPPYRHAIVSFLGGGAGAVKCDPLLQQVQKRPLSLSA